MYPMMIVASLGLAALTVLTFLTGIGYLEFEDGILAAALNAIVLLAGKAFTAMRPKKPKKDQQGFVRLGVLVLVAIVLALFTGCSTTYTGATSRTSLQAYGSSGTTVVLEVDSQHACTVTGTKSVLRVDPGTAQRICLAHPRRCRWLPAPGSASEPGVSRATRRKSALLAAEIGVQSKTQAFDGRARARESGAPSWARAGK